MIKKTINKTQITRSLTVTVERVGFFGTGYYRVLILENGEYSEVFHTCNRMRGAMRGFAEACRAVNNYVAA